MSAEAQDRLGIAPTISLSTNQASIDRAEEGSLVRVTAACTDDVQVRNCELYLDGVKAATDGNFPFEFFFLAPRLAERERFSVRVRVSDTGGNARMSDELVIELVPDATAPRITRVVPPADGVTGRAGVVAVFLDEPIDPAALVPASFELTFAGPDRLFGTPDDAPVTGALEFREQASGVFFTPAAGELAPGRYRARVQELRDVAGNETAPATWSFTVYGTGGADRDGDGVPDEVEALLGLDPDLADSDGDGILDGQEDFDGDGVPNAVEVALQTDLRSTDSDADGVPDALEDQDADLLPDWQEIVRATDPFHHDTDRDGFTDNDEVRLGSDPLDPRSTPLRAWTSPAVVRNQAVPGYSIGVEQVQAAITNRANPAHALGNELVGAAVRNEAAPEATTGQTAAPPTSVQNQPPP